MSSRLMFWIVLTLFMGWVLFVLWVSIAPAEVRWGGYGGWGARTRSAPTLFNHHHHGPRGHRARSYASPAPHIYWGPAQRVSPQTLCQAHPDGDREFPQLPGMRYRCGILW
jgi:hypothetical protein